MSLSEATATGDDTRATRVRWAAIAAVLAGLLTGSALILRPLLDIRLDTPPLLAFIALGVDLWQGAQPQSAAV